MRPPLPSNITSSHLLIASYLGWCTTVTMARPIFDNSFKFFISSVAEVESRPVVGSSKKRIRGLASISTPIFTLFLSPPDKRSPVSSCALPTRRSCTCSIRSMRMVSTTLLFLSCSDRVPSKRSRALISSVSLTVREGMRSSCCGTYPMYDLTASISTSSHSGVGADIAEKRRTCPPVGVDTPRRRESRVVLPAPDGPITAVTADGLMTPDIGCSIIFPLFTLSEVCSNSSLNTI
mmetsp:Transcript_29224/g.75252  ORF Transcript_29224/g.75252 Transcript_29224/m.75252 type:complete len:235 (+) Transcript_29224:1898-2602(+)